MESISKIEGLFTEQIEKLDTELAATRKSANPLSFLAAAPFLALAVAAPFVFEEFDYFAGTIAVILSLCAIGLSIIFWGIGHSARARAKRIQESRDRLVNLRLCLLSVPDEQLNVTELFKMISPRDLIIDELRTEGMTDDDLEDQIVHVKKSESQT